MGSIIIITVIIITVVNTSLVYSGSLANGSSSSLSTSTVSRSTSTGIVAWSASNAYPTGISTQSCVASTGAIYCVGGLTGSNTLTDVTNAVHFAPITAAGVGQWSSTTSYPVGIREESCVVSNNVIYCVGGYSSSAIIATVYYATVSQSGIGPWTATTSYPIPVWGHSCAASSGEIYCVGGITGPKSNTSAVYYAPLSQTGVGQWASTTSYPVRVLQESCVATGTDIYCIGGLGSNPVYYAPISSSGIGSWSPATKYPFAQGPDYPSCVALASEVYCVGGYTGPSISNAVYHATLSTSGIGPWMSSQNYPVGVWAESCVAAGAGIVCVGGGTASSGAINNVYQA